MNPPIPVLAVFFFCFSFQMLIWGSRSFLVVLNLGVAILRALPQALCWAMVAALPTIWGLRVIIHLGSGGVSRRNATGIEPLLPGRMEIIHKAFVRAESSKYSQEEVKNLLRSLALDLIALKKDLSEAETRQRFNRGDWTDDPALSAFLKQGPDAREEKRGRWPGSKKPRARAFPDDVMDAMDRLEVFSNFSISKGQYDPPKPKR